MTIEEEIEAISERLKFLKEQQAFKLSESFEKQKTEFMQRADTLDPRYKKLYNGINDLVNMSGWKDFYYGVLNYQKNCIDSGYIFK
ncbi:MAG: hypothetical protein P4L31_07565 [Candidatus Babeliales bacterium]|nr:hypothetical protein [Candidatus Babeliales bacterium]